MQLPMRHDVERRVLFTIPNVRDLSKNRTFFAGTSKGRPIMKRRGGVDKVQAAIALIVSSKVGSAPWPERKTWIDIFVQKKTANSDAHNCLPTLLDGIRDGLGVDDRWFAIGCLDWEIHPDDPNIWVQITT